MTGKNMYEKISEIIESKKYLLSENESYVLTAEFLHCDNCKFIEEVQSETGGYIEDRTGENYGYYLVFSQIL
jgi:hypothetical protein